MFGRKKAAAIAAEFLGTATLAFVVLNVSRSTIGIPYFVAFAAGLAVVLMGLSVATDVQLNPALTLALWTARRIKPTKAVVYIAAQLLGGWAAYALYKYFQHGTVSNVTGAFQGRILVAEAAGAFVFTLAAAKVFFQGIQGWNRAVIVGGAYALGIIVASASSNGFINPAVALGSNSWGWGTYVLGPVLGAIIGVNLYGLLFDQPTGTKKVAAATVTVSGGSASKSATTKSKTSKTKK
jgi:glycerol uptake facilitator-like aquaporin